MKLEDNEKPRSTIPTEKQDPLEDAPKKVKWHKEGGLVFCEFSTENAFGLLALMPSAKTKYITGEVKIEGKPMKVVLALPLEYHNDIKEAFEKTYGSMLKDVRGGFAMLEPGASSPQVALFGESQRFGEADHKAVVKLLEEAGISAKALS